MVTSHIEEQCTALSKGRQAFNIEGVRPTLQLAKKLAQLREPLAYGICARRSFRGLSVLERKM